ncbi:hypothetical protein P7C73_g5748, partial [Tremellales sp. Uapishka_1]
MGGKSFGAPGKRMTTAQLDHVYHVVAARLAVMFPQGMGYPVFYETKLDHGDLDLITAWDRATLDSMKGLSNGLPVDPATRGQVQVQDGTFDIRAFCEEVCWRAHTERWMLNGSWLHIKVPCREVFAFEAEYQVDEYIQIDVLLYPPPSVPFIKFALSYGTTIVLLGQLLRHLAKELVLQDAQLLIRHTPFFGFGKIDVHLTLDPQKLCEFVGCDFNAFQRRRFVDDRDFYGWFAKMAPGSMGEHGLQTLAVTTDGEMRMTSNKGKPGTIPNFLEWLRGEDSPFFIASQGTEEQAQPARPRPPPLDLEAQRKLQQEASRVDSQRPEPLSKYALLALKYFDKESEYAEKLELKRLQASEVEENQRRKADNKEKEEERKRLTEAEQQKAAAGRIGEGGGGAAVETEEVGQAKPKAKGWR